jgi:DNA-binding SARP family transcriptional activator/WD40 repeat protein
LQLGVVVEIRILGPVEAVTDEGKALMLGGAQQRAVLALLALEPDRVVSRDALISGIWDDPPGAAANTVQVYVSQLRKVLGRGVIRTVGTGYSLQVLEVTVDQNRFSRSFNEAGRQLEQGHAQAAGELLRGALGLWRGPALADVAEFPFAQPEVARLDELRLAAVEQRVEADLACGRHRALVAELEALVGRHPLRERLWGQLLLALYRSGRQADALAAFQRARDVLVDGLGIEPGAQLRRIEAAVLAQDRSLDAPGVPLPALPEPLAQVSHPFVGREEELAWLLSGLERAAAGQLVTTLLLGPTGIGKTRLATELARRSCERRIPVRYAAGPAAARMLAEESAPDDAPALVILDDLHLLPADAVGRLARLLAAVSPFRLVVASCDLQAGSAALRAVLDEQPLRTMQRRTLAPLDTADVVEIVRHYAPAADGTQVLAVATTLDGATPRRVQDVAGRWALDRATGRIREAAARLPGPRQALSGAHGTLVTGLLDLQHALTQCEADTPNYTQRLPLCPYKGLAPFNRDDTPYFRGRERLVAQTVARLVDTRLLAVVGASGSGKSSLVHAGLLPALTAGILPGSDRWRQVTLLPGDRPGDALARLIENIPTDVCTVVVVDQLEELFTLAPESQQQLFVARLTQLLQTPQRQVIAVTTLRSDYYGHCASHPDLARLAEANTILVGAMRPDELRQAIESPAHLAGLQIEPGVTDAILADAEHQPGVLPLLSTALLSLWEHRAGRTLTLAGYHLSGGVRGAVARLAETAFGQLTTSEQAVARRILLRVAESPEEQAYVRRRVPLTEVAPPGDHAARRVLDTLAGRRLLTVEEATVEVAHEALLREWPRLRAWLDEDDTGRRLRRHLTPAARDWADHGRHPSDLDRGPRLATALEWARDHQTDLTAIEREFLTASRALHTRTLHRLRATVAALTALLAAAASLGVLAWQSSSDAQDQHRLAEAHSHNASLYLVSQAQAIFHDDPQLSLLLTVAGAQINDNAEAGASLHGQATLRQNVTGFLTGHTGGVDMAFSSDGGTLAAVGGDGTMMVWNRNDKAAAPLTVRTSLTDGILGIAVSSDGHTLAAFRADKIVRYDLRTQKQSPLPTSPASYVKTVTFSPNGQMLASADADKTITLWNAHGRIAPPLTGHNDDILAVTFDSDGQTLASADADGTILLWNLRTHTHAAPLTGHNTSSGILDLAFSPDRKTLASAGENGTVDLWDVTRRTWLASLPGHTADVDHLAFNPSGQTLASADTDKTVILSDVQSHATITTTTIDGNELAFEPDGQTLASASAGNAVILWDIRSHDPADLPATPALLDYLCAKAGRDLTAQERARFLAGYSNQNVCPDTERAGIYKPHAN